MTLVPAWLRDGFLKLVDPLVAGLIRRGVHPNAISTVGVLVIAGSGVAFAGNQVRLGGALLLLSGVCDILDGRVARGGGKASVFGAFYDSTLDRVGESALFTGILVWFLQPDPRLLPVWGAVLTVIALASSLIVSYTRARAEGLGLDCKVGIAQRAERVLILGVPMLLAGAGDRGWIMLLVVALLAVGTCVTVVQRVVWVWQQSAPPPAASPAPAAEPRPRQSAVTFDRSHQSTRIEG